MGHSCTLEVLEQPDVAGEDRRALSHGAEIPWIERPLDDDGVDPELEQKAFDAIPDVAHARQHQVVAKVVRSPSYAPLQPLGGCVGGHGLEQHADQRPAGDDGAHRDDLQPWSGLGEAGAAEGRQDGLVQALDRTQMQGNREDDHGGDQQAAEG